jgi:hypothetical protein
MDKIIKDGTTLLIDDRFAERVELANEGGIISDREYEEWESAAHYDIWLHRHIKFEEKRVNRKRVCLTWHITSVDVPKIPHFNLIIFRKLGYKIMEPTQYKIALVDCPDDFLTETEIVHKYMRIKCTEAYRADNAMKSILEVMNDHGIVFYKP